MADARKRSRQTCSKVFGGDPRTALDLKSEPAVCTRVALSLRSAAPLSVRVADDSRAAEVHPDEARFRQPAQLAHRVWRAHLRLDLERPPLVQPLQQRLHARLLQDRNHLGVAQRLVRRLARRALLSRLYGGRADGGLSRRSLLAECAEVLPHQLEEGLQKVAHLLHVAVPLHRRLGVGLQRLHRLGAPRVREGLAQQRVGSHLGQQLRCHPRCACDSATRRSLRLRHAALHLGQLQRRRAAATITTHDRQCSAGNRSACCFRRRASQVGGSDAQSDGFGAARDAHFIPPGLSQPAARAADGTVELRARTE
mmetsp:Transcript_7714/g.22531  ORF Transcript_7714/g.22531 Transcript_7714/m.22531 type:complete len:311 (-) Transcript_7714:192-1124(-)